MPLRTRPRRASDSLCSALSSVQTSLRAGAHTARTDHWIFASNGHAPPPDRGAPPPSGAGAWDDGRDLQDVPSEWNSAGGNSGIVSAFDGDKRALYRMLGTEDRVGRLA